ncbi:adenylate/guanylate cyclase domain-containing protein [Massilia niastensis]|uniref:adenylate/guanylate cyclase domain-containing protein n=1 Tax=Massilia niastensis TaxID=544911 RepID=UPI00035E3777|nr:adenylate/guanylate cyclase domain-containing protein [Massilia niastensis]
MPIPVSRRPWWAALALAVALLSALAARVLDPRLFDLATSANRAWAPQPLRHDVVVVGIDDAFLDAIDEPLALSHAHLAGFLRAAAGAGPAAVGLDLVLPEKRFDRVLLAGDPQRDLHRLLLAGLLESMRSTPLVLAKVWDHRRGHFRDIQIDYASVLAMQEGPVRSTASALVLADADGRVRKYAGAAVQPGGFAWTLASELSAAMGVRRSWEGMINYQIGDEFSYIPLQDVLRLAREGRDARLRELFGGKIVLLGTVEEDTDLIEAPVPLATWLPGKHAVPGVLVHAQTVRSMLNGGLIVPAPPMLAWALTLAGALFLAGRTGARKLALLLAWCAGALLLCLLLLRQQVWLPVAGTVSAALLASLARALWQAWHDARAKRALRSSFAGYVSPAVLREIEAGRLDAGAGSSVCEVCVLFSDIRGFTALSERLAPEAVVALLNRYFSRMTAVVHKHGGTVDKFIGDGLMAVFGAPNVLPSSEKAALEAAHEMLVELAALNGEWRDEHGAPLEIGIGVHSGKAIAGHIGSPERHAFTVVGDTVNVAARLEALSKEVGYPIVCSQAVAAALGHPPVLAALGEHQLRGRKGSLALYGWRPA